ncbi:MAG: HAD hydrolase-like protein [Labilithrix sp.]|nr:HAD hydrolase-like protein [Labilithrix sp.]MCW5814345.1 HAD hydrolase-like protein [Labilithrix sp.]
MRALFFDLDGTLVDSRRDIAEALNRALAGAGMAPLALSEVLPLVGDGARVLVERALAARGRGPDDAVLAAFQEAYLAAPCVHTTLLPGAKEALALGLPCALVTNKPRAVTELVLERLGVRDAFREVWAGGDGPLKPAPDGVLSVAARLGVSVHDAWMIGDGPQDVLAGKAAGAFTVGVRGGIAGDARLLAAAPDLVVASLLELAAHARR